MSEFPTLTSWQSFVLFQGRTPPTMATYFAMVRRGILIGRETLPGAAFRVGGYAITAFGLDMVRSYCSALDHRMMEAYPDVPFVSDEEDLEHMLKDFGVSIVVLNGTDPLLVMKGDPGSPIAILSAFLRWKIEGVKSEGKFLQRVPGKKGTYGYRLKEETSHAE